jgi:HlyD family secretion protein
MKSTIIILLVISLSAVLFLGCGNGQEKNFLGSGTLEAEEVTVSSLVAGRLETLLVQEGDSTEADQIIAVVDTSKLAVQLEQQKAALEELTANRTLAANAIAQAQTQVKNLKANLDRQQNLLQTGSSTQQIVDDLSSQEQTAALRLSAAQVQVSALDAKQGQLQAAIELLRLQLRDAVIRAPLKGSVIEKYVDTGENVAPGSALIKIADLNHLWIKIFLAEEDVGKASLNQRVLVRIDALPNKLFEGRVSWISPKAEFTPRNVQTRKSRADLVFAVKVEFDNPQILASIGMPADVVLP